MSRSSVDLPQPDGPRMARNSAGATWRSTRRIASTYPGNTWRMFWRRSPTPEATGAGMALAAEGIQMGFWRQCREKTNRSGDRGLQQLLDSSQIQHD